MQIGKLEPVLKCQSRPMKAELAFGMRIVWRVYVGGRTLLKERRFPCLDGFVSFLRGEVVLCIVRGRTLLMSRALSSKWSDLVIESAQNNA